MNNWINFFINYFKFLIRSWICITPTVFLLFPFLKTQTFVICFLAISHQFLLEVSVSLAISLANSEQACRAWAQAHGYAEGGGPTVQHPFAGDYDNPGTSLNIRVTYFIFMKFFLSFPHLSHYHLPLYISFWLPLLFYFWIINFTFFLN